MVLLFALVALPGCGSVAVLGGSDGEAAPAPVPQSGWYATQLAEAASWSCSAGPGEDYAPERESALAEVEVAEAAMTWRWADAYDPIDCMVDDLEFACRLYSTSMNGSGGQRGMDAVITDAEELVAAWVADDRIEGASVRTLSCHGADCDLAATSYPVGFSFPCAGSRAFSAVLTEE